MTDKWNKRFMALARHVGDWSKDPSTKNGAVIVTEWNKCVTAVGFNGFPRGVDDDPERYEERAVKYKLVVHAEQNAIMNGVVLPGSSMFCTMFPCSECAKLIVQCGNIATVYAPPPREPTRPGDPWAEDAEYSQVMLRESGVYVEVTG
jgi:dCMP deaminase